MFSDGIMAILWCSTTPYSVYQTLRIFWSTFPVNKFILIYIYLLKVSDILFLFDIYNVNICPVLGCSAGLTWTNYLALKENIKLWHILRLTFSANGFAVQKQIFKTLFFKYKWATHPVNIRCTLPCIGSTTFLCVHIFQCEAY